MILISSQKWQDLRGLNNTVPKSLSDVNDDKAKETPLPFFSTVKNSSNDTDTEIQSKDEQCGEDGCKNNILKHNGADNSKDREYDSSTNIRVDHSQNTNVGKINIDIKSKGEKNVVKIGESTRTSKTDLSNIVNNESVRTNENLSFVSCECAENKNFSHGETFLHNAKNKKTKVKRRG